MQGSDATSRPATVSDESGELSPEQARQIGDALPSRWNAYGYPLLVLTSLTPFVIWFVAALMQRFISRPPFGVFADLFAAGAPLEVVGFVTGALIFVLYAAILLVYGRQWRWLHALRHDLKERQVIVGSGEVRHEKDGYVARIGRESLRGVDGPPDMALKPGYFHFSYLPRSRYLLRAIPLAGDNANDHLLDSLSEVFNFTLDDLRANRLLRFSVAQRRTMYLRFWLSLLGLLFGILGVDPAGWISQYVTERVVTALSAFQPPWLPAIPLVLTGLSFVTLALSILSLSLLLFDVRRGRLMMVEGPVEHDVVSDSEGDKTYYYVVDGARYQVSEAAYTALVPGQRYRLYVNRRNKAIISLEPL